MNTGDTTIFDLPEDNTVEETKEDIVELTYEEQVKALPTKTKMILLAKAIGLFLLYVLVSIIIFIILGLLLYGIIKKPWILAIFVILGIAFFFIYMIYDDLISKEINKSDND